MTPGRLRGAGPTPAGLFPGHGGVEARADREPAPRLPRGSGRGGHRRARRGPGAQPDRGRRLRLGLGRQAPRVRGRAHPQPRPAGRHTPRHRDRGAPGAPGPQAGAAHRRGPQAALQGQEPAHDRDRRADPGVRRARRHDLGGRVRGPRAPQGALRPRADHAARQRPFPQGADPQLLARVGSPWTDALRVPRVIGRFARDPCGWSTPVRTPARATAGGSPSSSAPTSSSRRWPASPTPRAPTSSLSPSTPASATAPCGSGAAPRPGASRTRCTSPSPGAPGTSRASPNADIHCAQRGVFAPSDFPFARDAIASESTPDVETVVIQDVALDLPHRGRVGGAVRTWSDRRSDPSSVRFKDEHGDIVIRGGPR